MRQQLVDPMERMRQQPLQNVLEVDPWIVSVQLGRLHQAHHDGGALTGQFAAAEEPCFAPHRPWAHQALDMVVVDADLTIVHEA